MTDRIAILGASRGIGFAISQLLEPRSELLLVSRKWPTQNLKSKRFSLDLTSAEDLNKLKLELLQFLPQRIFYVAGGGPFGEYASKAFKDHLWAYRLNLLVPAEVLHWCMRGEFKNLRQIIFVGSAIAEDKGDVFAASYSSAKHGLLGLLRSVQKENPKTDLRLYSPGYTATSLLPKSAQEKYKPQLSEAIDVARDFVSWALLPEGEKHRIYQPHHIR